MLNTAVKWVVNDIYQCECFILSTLWQDVQIIGDGIAQHCDFIHGTHFFPTRFRRIITSSGTSTTMWSRCHRFPCIVLFPPFPGSQFLWLYNAGCGFRTSWSLLRPQATHDRVLFYPVAEPASVSTPESPWTSGNIWNRPHGWPVVCWPVVVSRLICF